MIDLRGSVRIGSLCSGYGGLDAGVEQVFPDASVAWFVEYDKDPSKILAHHWPDVPNHGDVKTTDWAAVEPIDILTAGYPCQPFSHAGKRKGADDPRHLWPDVARAIGALRPGLVVLENVAGHVSLGLADVLGDLSALGYDATWGVVRAADAGAPHGRARIFIVANPSGDAGWFAHGDGGAADADPADDGRERRGLAWTGRPGSPDGGLAASHAHDGSDNGERPRPQPGWRGSRTAADATGERRGEGRPQSARRLRGPAAVVGGPASPDTDRGRRDGRAERDSEPAIRHDAPLGYDADGRVLAGWGPYGPAIRRWEAVLGRPAPRPTEPGRNGRPRLSPRFVEWMQGLEPGHVTDVPDLSRNAQLKALGNGVVPQQAALALRLLLRSDAETWDELLDQVQILDPEAAAS